MEELNLIYNNKNTLTDLGLTMAERPCQPVPTKRATKIEVPGRDGELNIYDGTYEPIEFSVEFNFRGLSKEDFDKKAREVKLWLLDSINTKLHFSFLDGFYKVNRLSLSDIERVDINGSGKFKVKFVCDPFLHDNVGQQVITLNYSASTQYLVNNSYKSNPYIKIYGSGTLTLTINGQAIVFTSVTDYVEIDTDLVECYKGTTAKNNTMTGSFPVLENGSNSIAMSSGITKIEVIPRWKSL